LSPVQSRTLAWVLVAAVVFFVIALVATPIWRASSDHHETITALQNRLARYASVAAQSGPGIHDIAAARQRARELRLLLPGDRVVTAAAGFQSRIMQLLTADGATVANSQTSVSSDKDGLTRVDLNLSFQADIAAIAKALYKIENGAPLVVARQLVIRDPNGDWAAASEPSGNAMQCDLLLSAFWQASGQ